MHIEIQLPRPGLLLLAIAAVSGWGMYLSADEGRQEVVIEAPEVHQHQSPETSTLTAQLVPAAPSIGVNQAAAYMNAASSAPARTPRFTVEELRVLRARQEQEFMLQREIILRAQIQELQRVRDALGATIDPSLEQQFRDSVQMLTALLKDQKKAEEFLHAAYKQLWQAEEGAIANSGTQPQTSGRIAIHWPVDPSVGLSASFLDEGYKARFKIDHYGIDIKVRQGTAVLSAAEGFVKTVVKHGYGLNYVIVQHDGFTTAYLHLSQIDVQVGQRLLAGDRVGLSGGRPGTPGAGFSTGEHLHFGLYVNGTPVDPMEYLPKQ